MADKKAIRVKLVKNKMNSKNPIKMEGMPQKDLDKQLLRFIMMSELDAINEYEQMCYTTDDKEIKDLLDHLIEEEEEHLKMAQTLLDSKEQAEEDAEDTEGEDD